MRCSEVCMLTATLLVQAVFARNDYDCNAGYDNFQTVWSVGQMVWCCEQSGRACPMDKSSGSTSALPFDCDAGVRFKFDWSAAKKTWCCSNKKVGCTTGPAVSNAQEPEESAADSKCGGPFAQCGGHAWHGATCCKTGCSCEEKNKFYSACKPPSGWKLCDREAALPEATTTLWKKDWNSDDEEATEKGEAHNAVACIDETDCESTQECFEDVCQAAVQRRRRTPRRRRSEALAPTDVGYMAGASGEACLTNGDCRNVQVCVDDKCQAVGGRRLAHKAGRNTSRLRG